MNTPFQPDKNNIEVLKANKNPIKLDKCRKILYEKAIKEDLNVEVLRSILAQTNIDSSGVDNGVDIMNNILINAAKRASFGKRAGKGNKTNKKPKTNRQAHVWYTNECKNREKLLRKYSKELSCNPFDKAKRHKFVKARAEYKKVCRKAEAESRRQLTKKLIEIGQSDPKLFWSTIKKMNTWGKTQTDPTDNIKPEKWIDYFQKLLNEKKSPSCNTNTPLSQ